MSDLIYLYGFIDRPNGEAISQWTSQGLFVIPYTDVAVLVRYVPEEEFGEAVLNERMKDVKWLENQLWAHERVLEGVMKEQTVVPLKWGTLFRTQESAQRVLVDQYSAIRGLINRLKGRQEWTVRVYLHRERLNEIAKAQDPQIQRLLTQVSKLPEGTAYLMSERIKLLTQEAGQRMLEAALQEFLSQLTKNVEDSAVSDPVGGTSNSEGQELVFQRVFLVAGEKLQGFSDAISGAAKKWRQQGFEIHQVGPFPPYYFSHLELKGSQSHG